MIILLLENTNIYAYTAVGTGKGEIRKTVEGRFKNRVSIDEGSKIA